VQRQQIIASVYFFIAPSSVAVFFFLTLFHPPHHTSHTVSVGPCGDVMLRADEEDTASGKRPAASR
jgi:hypothetical protein